jgi:Uma2 family endonuclease
MQEPNPPPTKADQLTYEQFLAYVMDKEGRFEYVDGRAVAMAPASRVHQRLAKRLTVALDAHLGKGPCEVLPSPGVWTIVDRRERVPDLAVFCEGEKPRVMVEILSPNLGDDLGDKVLEYQGLHSVAEYVIVDSRKRWVIVHRRGAEGLFVVDIEHISGAVWLDSIGFTLDVDALYNDSGVA